MIDSNKCLFCGKVQEAKDEAKWKSHLIIELPDIIMLGSSCFDDEEDKTEKIRFTVCPQCRGKHSITDAYVKVTEQRFQEFAEYINDKSVDSGGYSRFTDCSEKVEKEK